MCLSLSLSLSLFFFSFRKVFSHKVILDFSYGYDDNNVSQKNYTKTTTKMFNLKSYLNSSSFTSFVWCLFLVLHFDSFLAKMESGEGGGGRGGWGGGGAGRGVKHTALASAAAA